MWVFVLIAFGFMNGVFSESVCENKVAMACPLSAILEKSLPGTEEELTKSCLFLEKTKKCMINFLKKCNGAEYDENSIMEGGSTKDTLRLLKVATEVCKKDSDLHSRFVQNMSCLKKVSDDINEDQNCDGLGIQGSSIAKTKLKYIVDRIIRSDIHECKRVLSDMNCFLSRYFDECGGRAKDTAVELIQKGGSLDEQCPRDIRRHVLRLFNLWAKETGKNVYVHELFS
ncbi:uncharacterized protein LOC129984063 [Argiope bruennichi]|uniref:uncharacterized protein LOC129984063 n=1 Tax=Argiope bruennichi TaxID=94029 RepID=UPI002494BFD4|nr:uncharacterized protein LOC129984063 [Argiope bruennichi]